MTLETGLRYPHKLAGLIGISGYVHDEHALIKELSPVAKEQRILWTHGTRDPLVPFDETKAQMELLRGAGLQIQWEEFLKEHTISMREVEVIREFIGRALELKN